MTERTVTDGSGGTAESESASEAGESDRESTSDSASERECPACGDRFEDGVAYRDHLFSVGLVY